SIAHIENFTGAGAADQFIASVGDGTNRYDGAGGGDTYNLSGTNAGAIVTATNATSAEIGPDTLVSIEKIIGNHGHDTLALAAGVNVIDGQGGDDTIHGGAGNDRLTGGAGNDTFTYTIGDGADTVDGGAGFVDSLTITGTVAAETLNVVFNGTALTSVEG